MWKLNESLLQDPVVLEEVQRKGKHFLELMIHLNVPLAVNRGVLIKHGTRIKFEREAVNILFIRYVWLRITSQTCPYSGYRMRSADDPEACYRSVAL